MPVRIPKCHTIDGGTNAGTAGVVHRLTERCFLVDSRNIAILQAAISPQMKRPLGGRSKVTLPPPPQGHPRRSAHVSASVPQPSHASSIPKSFSTLVPRARAATDVIVTA